MDENYEKYGWMPDIPKKWNDKMVTYDEKHKWFPVTGSERKESWVTIPCTAVSYTHLTLPTKRIV